jgi:hypothetical protein
VTAFPLFYTSASPSTAPTPLGSKGDSVHLDTLPPERNIYSQTSREDDGRLREAQEARCLVQYLQMQTATKGETNRAGFGKPQMLLGDVNMTMSRLGPQMDDIQQRLEGSRRSDILDRFSTIPYTNHHQRIHDGRLEGTGEWQFEKAEYRAWRESSCTGRSQLAGRLVLAGS